MKKIFFVFILLCLVEAVNVANDNSPPGKTKATVISEETCNFFILPSELPGGNISLFVQEATLRLETNSIGKLAVSGDVMTETATMVNTGNKDAENGGTNQFRILKTESLINPSFFYSTENAGKNDVKMRDDLYRVLKTESSRNNQDIQSFGS